MVRLLTAASIVLQLGAGDLNVILWVSRIPSRSCKLRTRQSEINIDLKQAYM
jgi:hypothetical protein